MTAALLDLETRNLVERNVDPANRRRKVVTATQAGIEHLHQLDEVLDGIQEELLAPLAPDQRQQFTEIMKRLG